MHKQARISKPAPKLAPEPDFDEVERGNLIRWDEPKEVTGRLVSKSTVTGQFGEQVKIQLELDDGSIVDCYAPAMLASLLNDPRVQPGRLIRIDYPGTYTKSKAGRPVKEFRLFVARDGQ
jgi:hypothetical protein